MQKMDSFERLKDLFRELFQLDMADLDFGLYRLFRLKRAEVEAFLNEQLPKEVERAFEAVTSAEREALEKQVEERAKQARASVADDAILPSGEPNPKYAETKAVTEYVEARKRLAAVDASEAQRADVFNLLYAFFSRYYDDGDFIPRRFFGARSTYAVPYNGEEVFFHWANKDQYYVKSGEAFRDYAFTVSTLHGEYRVRFKLVEATTPKDNTKGDTRFFFPLLEAVAFEPSSRTFTIPFEYRLPTEAEVASYGKNAKGQAAILDEAELKILEAVPDELLRAALAAPSPTGRESQGEEPPTLLRRRLAHFTKKNTTDYFVHKNLGAFLRQELEFFIRDQVVHELDLEGDFEAKRRVLRVFRKLADTVITFLAQIEDAQKRLFEKTKFVLRTDYLIPIQHVPREFWLEILQNEGQLAEWRAWLALEPQKDLFNQEGTINEACLEAHPTLPVHTKHFDRDFVRRLLEALPFEDLDEATDGLLVHGENYQALNLLLERYREQVKCIYIDPPYNTGNDEFIYKDRYQHSGWLAMMESRLTLAKEMLSHEGVFFATVDDNEDTHLRALLDLVFGAGNFAARAIWQKVYSPRMDAKGFSQDHDYVMTYTKAIAQGIGRIGAEQDIKQFNFTDAITGRRYRRRSLRKEGKNSRRLDRPNLFYALVAPDGSEVLPIRPDGSEGCWRWAREKYEDAAKRGLIEWVRTERGWEVYVKQFYDEQATRPPSSVWLHTEVGHNHEAAEEVKALYGSSIFGNPKPTRLVRRMLEIAGTTHNEPNNVVLDFFAGSGTTGHAVINLNREDGGCRKFILVEMGDYFHTVLLPRIAKVMYTPEWKDGKPKREATPEEAERTPRLVKILRVESYEDALHNTFSDQAIERLAEREQAYRQAVGDEEYRIRYLVKLPLEASDSMLNLAKLEHPFDYTLEILTDHGPRTETVDLVETFNWLYGLRVHRLLTWVNEQDKAGKELGGRSYRVVVASDREGKKRVLVVWRDMTGLDPVVERPFLEAKAKELGPFEEQWINGDSAAKGFASLDGLFKRLMEGGGQ